MQNLILNHPSPRSPDSGIYREECYRCYRAKKNCLCGLIKPFSTNMRFIILMHLKEARREKKGTARLASLFLKNSEILIGDDFTDNKRVNALIGDPVYSPMLLFPGPDALNFKTIAARAGDPSGKGLLIFILDGTWSCALKMFKQSKNLQGLPKVSFSREYRSQFKFKRQPREECLSTLEALYYLCKEAEQEGYENLGNRPEAMMELFNTFIESQIAYNSKHKGKAKMV